METIIFYAPYVVCIILLFIVGYIFTKINKYRSNVQFWREEFDVKFKQFNELQTSKAELLKLFGLKEQQIEVLKSKTIELEKWISRYANEREAHIMTIDEKQKQIIQQSKALQKQSDEIIVLKQQVKSLTNHLQERAKPFDPLAALDELIPTKMETKKKFKKQ